MSIIFNPDTREGLSELADRAAKIVLDAGAFMSESEISSIEQKEGHANFVTDLDVKVQKYLVNALSPFIPSAAFILEEGDNIPASSAYVWIIDPIDGTQNFINHYGHSAISVGLVHENTGLIGIVYNPFHQELFTAVQGQGAFLNGSPIRASEKPLENSILCIGTSPYYEELRPKVLAAIEKLYPICGDFRRSGSAALELCYIACGRCDGYFEYRLCPWDYAAGAIILKEAGGVTGAIDGSDWDYTKPAGIIAGGRNLFCALQHILH